MQKKSSKDKNFPMVGLGASAGGLEALELFFSNVPANSGMAYMVVQHLDPNHKGMLPELLQRNTRMKVVQVEDRMIVKPNCVYVIPPNTSMSIEKGRLRLSDPAEAHGMRLPIDFFFRSLAEDQRERSIGVILSGMGSDGTAGISAIKEKNGIVMVQDPATAKYDSMPRSAINSLPVDIIAPAGMLPPRLIEYLKQVTNYEADPNKEIKEKSALDQIIILLSRYTGNDFSMYKKNTLYRRIERRMGVYKIEKISDYVSFLQKNPKEVDILFKELMIGVTNFFRDYKVWNHLRDTVIPDIIQNLQPGSILRAWVPGCSTGEEAYSLAIVFKEVIESVNPHGGFSLQVFATDLNRDAIETARKGVFKKRIEDDVTAERLNRFFLKSDEGYFIKTEIRESVVFAQHNVIMHPPFTRIDFLSCRNLLIYLEPQMQQKLIGLFSYCLNPDGIMLLGNSEDLGTQSRLFLPLEGKLKIFKRVIDAPASKLFDFPNVFPNRQMIQHEKSNPIDTSGNIQRLADQLLMNHSPLAGVLVNETGDIIYISGRTGKYLEPAIGKANMNIFAMLREGLHHEFPVAFRKAILNKQTVVLNNIKVVNNSVSYLLNVTIIWIDKPQPLNGLIMIIFKDVVMKPEAKPTVMNDKKSLPPLRQSELEKELKETREKMNAMAEEMQTSQEELQTTNEELQSTNEELQSANEELTSSKEEMQSLNEEMQTLNSELQTKVDDFTSVSVDMKNLLNSTDIATLFLDNDLNIRRFTNQTTKIFKLIKTDLGRPITDLVTDLEYPDLVPDISKVIKSQAFIQKPVPTKDGRWFSVRIMPYRTINDKVDGVVITFFNISDLKQVELKLQETDQMNRMLLDSYSEAVIKLTPSWEIVGFNAVAEKFFDTKRKDAVNQNFIQIFIPKSQQKKYEKELKKILTGSNEGIFEMTVIAAGGKTIRVKWSVFVLLNTLNKPTGMIITQKNN